MADRDAAFREALDAYISLVQWLRAWALNRDNTRPSEEEINAARARVLALYAERDERVTAISTLKDGWDSYGGKAPTVAALKTARLMASVPSVVPTRGGGVQFEWHRDGVDIEIEIAPDGTIGELYAERQGAEYVVIAPIMDGWPDYAVLLDRALFKPGDRVRVTKVEEAK